MSSSSSSSSTTLSSVSSSSDWSRPAQRGRVGTEWRNQLHRLSPTTRWRSGERRKKALNLMLDLPAASRTPHNQPPTPSGGGGGENIQSVWRMNQRSLLISFLFRSLYSLLQPAGLCRVNTERHLPVWAGVYYYLIFIFQSFAIKKAVTQKPIPPLLSPHWVWLHCGFLFFTSVLINSRVFDANVPLLISGSGVLLCPWVFLKK